MIFVIVMLSMSANLIAIRDKYKQQRTGTYLFVHQHTYVRPYVYMCTSPHLHKPKICNENMKIWKIFARRLSQPDLIWIWKISGLKYSFAVLYESSIHTIESIDETTCAKWYVDGVQPNRIYYHIMVLHLPVQIIP